MSKTKKNYRVFLKSFDDVAGFGDSPSKAIENLKNRVTGRAIEHVMRMLKEDDERIAKGEAMIFYRYDTAIADVFNRYKLSLIENGSYSFDVFDEEYNEEREEWLTVGRDTWYPKYEIKL